MKIFHATYRKFLTAIDHIDYHPSRVQSNIARTKRSVTYEIYGCYHSPTKTLTPSEESFLTTFMEALYKINPSLHKNLSRMKRVGIFTWILGWGIFSNARNIAKIKDNIHILQKQNQLQDKQIKQLANYLNLTMHQVDKHSEMLYELDTKMTIMNKTITTNKCGMLMLCNMKQIYYISFRINYIEYILLYMPYNWTLNHYLNT